MAHELNFSSSRTAISGIRYVPAPETPFPPAAHRLGESANWVVSVIEHPADAARARDAAVMAGIARDEILVLSGEQALQIVAQKEARMNPVMRLYARLTRACTDPGNAESEYREEAAQGYTIVSIRAEKAEDIVRAQRVLLAHNARRMKHYGKWVLTELAH